MAASPGDRKTDSLGTRWRSDGVEQSASARIRKRSPSLGPALGFGYYSARQVRPDFGYRGAGIVRPAPVFRFSARLELRRLDIRACDHEVVPLM